MALTLLVLLTPMRFFPSTFGFIYDGMHVLIFGGLSFLWIRYQINRSHDVQPIQLLQIAVACCLVGVILELVQDYIPQRSNDPKDLVANLFGVASGTFLGILKLMNR